MGRWEVEMIALKLRFECRKDSPIDYDKDKECYGKHHPAAMRICQTKIIFKEFFVKVILIFSPLSHLSLHALDVGAFTYLHVSFCTLSLRS